MDYFRIYDQLIAKARSCQEIRISQKQSKISYFEGHHIIPRSMGGEGNTSMWYSKRFNYRNDNIVGLTPKEHFICHKLLCEMYPGNKKLKYALWRMSNIKNTKRDLFFTISASEYNRLRNEIVRISNEYTHSEITLDKMSKCKKGKTYEEIFGVEEAIIMKQRRSEEGKNKTYVHVHSDETRNLISKNTMGRNKGKTYEEIFGEIRVAKIRMKRTVVNNPFFGKSHSEETKRKISETKKLNKQLKLINN